MAKKAVLMVNLGSPDSTEVGSVRRYLKEFLSDPRVIDLLAPIRALVLNLFILPFRPQKSAEAYRRIWQPEGSPLLITSKRQRTLLQEQVDVPIILAMRYGNPSIVEAVAQLARDGVDDIYLMPLYPHYAMSSYESVVVRLMEEITQQKPTMHTSLLQPFYQETGYIEAIFQNAKPYLREDYDLLLFSFHSIPERHLRKTDPSHAHCLTTPDCCNYYHPSHATCYRHQCLKTVEKFAARAGIPREKYTISFQSRLGRDPWLQPYTDVELRRFAQEGVKKILVICPSFVADCLETLEEIAIEGKKIFEEGGGETLVLIPCLNEHPAWVHFLAGKVKSWLTKAALS